MPGKGMQSCPVCGTQYATTGPGGPCSSACSIKQRQQGMLGTGKVAEPSYGTGRTDRRGKSTKPGPAPKRKGGCPIVLLPPAVGVAALVAMLLRRRR